MPTIGVAACGHGNPAPTRSLFFDHLDSPLDAIGLPVAADVGFLTMAAGVELMATLQQVDAISDDLADIGLG